MLHRSLLRPASALLKLRALRPIISPTAMVPAKKRLNRRAKLSAGEKDSSEFLLFLSRV